MANTIKCMCCKKEFEPFNSLTKYCSKTCKWKMHKRTAKETERNKTGYYANRIKSLRDAGYLVINPKNRERFLSLWNDLTKDVMENP